MKELILKRIDELKVTLNHNKDWREFEEALNSDDYVGAGDYFGHSDDCFDAGIDYGQYLSALDELDFLEKLVEGK